MKIVLLKDMENLGNKYDVVEVKNGYGMNYLIPQKIALIANQANINKLKTQQKSEEKKLALMVDVFKDHAKLIESKVFEIGAKAGTTDKIFGSVTNIQLANKIKEELGIEIDRKVIEIDEEVKTLGQHTAKIRLHPEVVATMTFEVVKE
ncbi:MAG: 50S ribosomal protein L9 [Deltaproteobacteria bacterium]